MLTKLLKQCIRKMSIAVCSLKVMPSSWRLASRTRRKNDGNLAGLDLNVCKYACNHCFRVEVNIKQCSMIIDNPTKRNMWNDIDGSVQTRWSPNTCSMQFFLQNILSNAFSSMKLHTFHWNFTEMCSNWRWANTAWGTGLVPSSNLSLPQPMLTKTYNTIWHR